MITEAIQALVPELSLSVAAIYILGLSVLLGTLRSKLVATDILHGVPELKYFPLLGAAPLLLWHGAAELLERLIAIGVDGISYASVVNTVIISINHPGMMREVLACTDEVASRWENCDIFRKMTTYANCAGSREGDLRKLNWSPFLTLRRLIGNNLFSSIGPEASNRRSIFSREFAGDISISEKFETMQGIAESHVKAMLGDHHITEISDFRVCADNFAVALWGELLYANPEYHLDGQVIDLADQILDKTGNPWASVWSSIQISLGILIPGEPTRSEAELRKKAKSIVDASMKKLEKY